MTTSWCRSHTNWWLLAIKLSAALRNRWSSSSISATRNVFGAGIVLGLVRILYDLLLSTLSVGAWRMTSACSLHLLFSYVTTRGARHQPARKLSSTYLVAMTTSWCRSHTNWWLLAIKLSAALRNRWSSSSISATRNVFGAGIVLGLVRILYDLLLSTLSVGAWRMTSACSETTWIIILFLLETSVFHPQLCLSILVIFCGRLSNL